VRDAFRSSLLVAARATLDVREVTRNSSPAIDDYLRYVHAKPGDPWCAAWVATMHHYAANALNAINPCPRTAGALRMWEMTLPECKIPLPSPGMVFFLDTGAPGGAGHCGIVEMVTPDGDTIVTIEGNTNAAGSREGDRVARHTWKWRDGRRGKLIGFADYCELLPLLPPSPFK
jgi:hypothetical protein